MWKIGQITGLIIFLAGVALLAFTYFLGYSLLTNREMLAWYANLIPLPTLNGGKQTNILISIIAAPLAGLASYVVPILILFVLGYITSKIVSNGIQVWRTKPETEEKKGASEVQAQHGLS
ncbi:MAG: hypothetical protein QXH24_04055 [Candidatus Bathyarchaeia archaeon]